MCKSSGRTCAIGSNVCIGLIQILFLAILVDSEELGSIGVALDCSLLQALQASPEFLVRARRGEISTNELVRQYKIAGIRRNLVHLEAREFERAQARLQGSKFICNWLAHEGMEGAYGEQIVGEVRWRLAMEEQTGKLPRIPEPIELSVADIIHRCRPSEPISGEISHVAWYAAWLLRWAFYSMTDAQVRDDALELALDTQCKQWGTPLRFGILPLNWSASVCRLAAWRRKITPGTGMKWSLEVSLELARRLSAASYRSFSNLSMSLKASLPLAGDEVPIWLSIGYIPCIWFRSLGSTG